MNGRVHKESTPEKRLAAIVVTYLHNLPLCPKCKEHVAMRQDYADVGDYLLPHLLYEFLEVQMKEAQDALVRSPAEQRVHVASLMRALGAIKGKIAKMEHK